MALRSALAFACIVVLAPAITQAQAQTWPQKTVRFIVPLPPGSGMDLSARIVAERLTERWGQPVVVENRQGADGIPAVQAFLQARDNHTFMFSFASIVTFNHLLHEKLPYDPKDIVPVAPVIDNFLAVSVAATLNVNTLADFVALAKSQPGKLNYAVTPGLPVYAMLALQRQTGIELANIPYRDFAPAYQDLASGRLHAASTGAPTLVPHHRAGTAKMLIVTNSIRTPQAPDVPTAREAGYPNLTFEGVSGVWGWRDIAPEIRQRVVTDVRTIVEDPAFRARVSQVGTVPRAGTSEEFAAAVEEQRAKIAAIHAAIPK